MSNPNLEAVLNGVFAHCIFEWNNLRVEIEELLDASKPESAMVCATHNRDGGSTWESESSGPGTAVQAPHR
jgi:hypothetical protein